MTAQIISFQRSSDITGLLLARLRENGRAYEWRPDPKVFDSLPAEALRPSSLVDDENFLFAICDFPENSPRLDVVALGEYLRAALAEGEIHRMVVLVLCGGPTASIEELRRPELLRARFRLVVLNSTVEEDVSKVLAIAGHADAMRFLRRSTEVEFATRIPDVLAMFKFRSDERFRNALTADLQDALAKDSGTEEIWTRLRDLIEERLEKELEVAP